MQPPAVSIRQLSKFFGHDSMRVVALDDVSVDIRQNEFFTLLGPSGCGKTTLLRLIAGFEHAEQGEILLGGESIAHLPPHRRPVNTVFQNYALFPHLNVADNIGFGLAMQGKPRGEIERAVNKMLALVQMRDLGNRRIDQISGGQQQRVALARALAPHPRVLLLDEPLSALDYKLRKEMQIELKQLQSDTGITFVFVTHDQEEALVMSDRIAVMNAGRILQIGAPNEIYDRPAARFVADFIGDTNFIRAKLLGGDSDAARLQLPSGAIVAARPTVHARDDASADAPTDVPIDVNVAVRPEQVMLCDDSPDADLRGVIARIVYSGTATHYHLRLSSGEAFVTREQNSDGQQTHRAVGDAVGVKLRRGVVHILPE